MWQWQPSRSGEQVGSPFLSFQVVNYFQTSFQKTPKISNTIQSLHISSKRDKNRIKHDVMNKTSLCIKRKPLPHKCLPYLMSGKSQYLQSGLPWIVSFLGNSKPYTGTTTQVKTQEPSLIFLFCKSTHPQEQQRKEK